MSNYQLRRWRPQACNYEINVAECGEEFKIFPIHVRGQYNLDRIPWVLVLTSKDEGFTFEVKHQPRIGSVGFGKMSLNDPKTVENLKQAVEKSSNSLLGKLELKELWNKELRDNIVYIVAKKRPEVSSKSNLVRARELASALG